MGYFKERSYARTSRPSTRQSYGLTTGDSQTSTVAGYKESVDFLKTLPENINRKILVTAMRRATRPFVRAAKQHAPVATRAMMEYYEKKRTIAPGTIKKSIGVIVSKSKNKNDITVYVGPKLKRAGKSNRDEKTNSNDPWFRHFVIRGTAGYTVKKGKNRGRFMPGQPANPFIDKAFGETSTQIYDELEKDITQSVAAYCKRHGVTFMNN